MPVACCAVNWTSATVSPTNRPYLHDPGDSRQGRYDLLALVRQRRFAIAQGYEDGNDAATLAAH